MKYRYTKITYSNIDPELRPVPYDPSMSAPLPPENRLACLTNEVVFNEDSNLTPSNSTGSEYEPEERLKPFYFPRNSLMISREI